MTAADRETMLAHGDALWAKLRAALDASIDAPANTSGWTGKDVYAHFARWQQHTINDLLAVLESRPLPRLEAEEDVINDRWREEDRSLPPDTVRERCVST